jgi:hypothetical protein
LRAVSFYSLLHLRDVSFARCSICVLLHLRAALETRCSIYVRLHFSAASFTRCSIHVLLRISSCDGPLIRLRRNAICFAPVRDGLLMLTLISCACPHISALIRQSS